MKTFWFIIGILLLTTIATAVELTATRAIAPSCPSRPIKYCNNLTKEQCPNYYSTLKGVGKLAGCQWQVGTYNGDVCMPSYKCVNTTPASWFYYIMSVMRSGRTD
jgi:uncharacterized Fe-S cluster protein YjdI